MEDVLRLYCEGNRTAAADLAVSCSKSDDAPLILRETASVLKRTVTCVAEEGVPELYNNAAAFEAFVDEYENKRLYAKTSRVLCDAYSSAARRLRRTTGVESGSAIRLSVIDIGAGCGTALLPALSQLNAQDPNCTVDVCVVEPSAKLLRDLWSASSTHDGGMPDFEDVEGHVKFIEWKDKFGNAFKAYCCTVQEFVVSEEKGVHWHIGQATFALQNVPSVDERRNVFSGFMGRITQFFVVEFDVPAALSSHELMDPDRVDFILDRFSELLEVYSERKDFSLVSQGFLIPNLLCKFSVKDAACTIEQPIQRWVDELEASGFCVVARIPLHNYWWASGVLIHAAGRW